MKSVVLVHTTLVLLGVAIGFGSEVPAVFSATRGLALTIVTLLITALLGHWLSRYAFSAEHRLFGYFFWWNYLSAVLCIGIGVALLTRSLLAGNFNYFALIVLFTGVGYMCPLIYLYRSYRLNCDSAH